MVRIDATKIIDRDAESQLFGQMVSFEVPPRVMVVSERSGMGKSDLLRKLELLSVRDHRVPAGRVELDEFVSRPDEFAVVTALHESLKDAGASLPNFETLSGARGLSDTLQFREKLRSVVGVVDMTNAQVTGGTNTISGVTYNISSDEFVFPSWDDAAEETARAICVEAFLGDLTEYAKENTVVLMFDGLDKVGESLRRWVINEFVRRRALTDCDDHKLVIVLAGSDVTQMILDRLSAAERERVEPLAPFAEWTPDQIQQFLDANDVGTMKPEEFEALCLLIRAGRSLMEVLFHAQMIAQKP